MKKKRLAKIDLRDGFTIIEVVLVLAIAGLIFLMVFIALPALQRSQRDTQRRDDIARANTALTQYMANNRNRVPTSFGASAGDGDAGSDWGDCPLTGEEAVNAKGFCYRYLITTAGDAFEDPDGSPYVFVQNVDGSYTEGDDDGPGSPFDPDAYIPNQGGNGLLALLETKVSTTDGAYGVTPGAFDHNIYVTYNGRCDGEVVRKATGDRKIAFQYKLEGGGVVCVNN